MEDEKIVELFISRDETALSYTANKYGAQLRGLANSLLADMPAAEECENDTYLQAWGSISTCSLFWQRSPGTWHWTCAAAATLKSAGLP